MDLRDVDPDTPYTERDDIVVITDEAHRTQYGMLALNMRNALPNAACIGFTGTPLFKEDEITRRVFGQYVSTYDFQRAVEDGATVPLYYDARGEELGVTVDDLNERIADKLEELEIEDIDVAQRLEQELRRDYHVVTAGRRLDQVARDFVHHYSKAWETGKAMLVCIDKVTCVRMRALIDRYWNERTQELAAERKQAPDEQEAIYLKRQMDWMHETRIAVVVSEEQGEVEKFRKWELDITPHRRLLKEGMDPPESMRKQPRFRNMQRMAVDDVIRKTGFERNAAIVACKEAANENDETRKRFEVMCREVFKKFRACINVQGVNAHRADRNAIDIVYKSLQRDRQQADISDIIRKLHEVVDEAIEVRSNRQAEEQAPYDISRIDFDRLKREFDRSPRQRTTVQALKDAVEKKLRRLLEQNPLRTDFQRHYEAIVAEYNREKDRVTIERTFEALLKLVKELDEEESRAVREGLDEESLAIFDLLKKPDLRGAEVRRIKQVAVELLRTLKVEKLRVDQWREKESTRDAVHVTIRDFLWSDETGLPADGYSEDEVKVISDNVFLHVFRAYPEVPSPYYESAEAA